MKAMDNATEHDILIIGGGAAGLLAAIAAASHGGRPTLLERNPRLGIKVLMSGGGRCNITNTGDIQHLVRSFPGNGRFLFSAFSAFSNQDIRHLLAEEGVTTHVEDRGRVFPDSGTARDVVEALENRARRLGVVIHTGCRVVAVARDPESSWFQVQPAGSEPLRAPRLIIATGGMTYPTAGTTGDGFAWARQFGHSIVTPRPAIVALETVERWPADLKGVALRDVWVLVRAGGKVWAREPGDLLFTHFGLSGPAVLNASHQAVLAREKFPEGVELVIRLERESSREEWEQRLLAAFQEHPRQHLKTVLHRWWPSALPGVLLPLVGADPDQEAAHVNKATRRAVAGLLHELVLHLRQPRPLAQAMVTAGGVDVREVNPKTMASRLVPGLYFAGEVLDVDGISGGYNLQAAYSTGWLAGRSAALGQS